MAKSNRISLKDLRQGVTVYQVHAFGPGRRNHGGWVEAKMLMGRPKKSPGVGSLYVSYLPPSDSRNFPKDPHNLYRFFLSDRNISCPGKPAPHLSFHAAFRSRKAAERYLARIQSGCFTPAERERFEAFTRRDELSSLFTNYL